jgi:SAM-dependent methyltransferase
MGEFSAQWLSLREPVDHASRSTRVQDVMLADLRARHGDELSGLRLLDLGCGSGSNLRAIAPLLGDRQHWTLVDYDHALLTAARQALKSWADEVVLEQVDSLHMICGGAQVQVEFREADLARDVESVLAVPADLVTASALFDLVSSDWVDRFCRALPVPLYAVLSFDGQMSWAPEHPLDSDVVLAFAAHQATDKGFGSALGPNSGQYLSQALHSNGLDVTMDKSPWVVDELPSAFHDMLIDGIAQAVSETHRFTVEQVEGWLHAHRSALRCIIGHDDLYASRPGLR